MSSSDLCALCFQFAMDELTPPETERFAVHLEQCMPCKKEYEELRELRAFVESSMVNEPIRNTHRSLRVTRWGWVGLTAAIMFTTFTALLQNRALAYRFQETAHDLRSGMSHPTTCLRTEADKIIDTHFALHRKTLRGSSPSQPQRSISPAASERL